MHSGMKVLEASSRPKGGIISENFTLAPITKKKVTNLSPEHFLFQWIVLSREIRLLFLKIGAKVKNEIKRPLASCDAAA